MARLFLVAVVACLAVTSITGMYTRWLHVDYPCIYLLHTGAHRVVIIIIVFIIMVTVEAAVILELESSRCIGRRKKNSEALCWRRK